MDGAACVPVPQGPPSEHRPEFSKPLAHMGDAELAIDPFSPVKPAWKGRGPALKLVVFVLRPPTKYSG